MECHERATSVWYRIAGLLHRKELAIETIEAEIRSDRTSPSGSIGELSRFGLKRLLAAHGYRLSAHR